MSKILLVDVDTGMQNVIMEMLKEHSGQVDIMTSGDAKEVPNIISSIKVNMLIVDLKMPDFEDFEIPFANGPSISPYSRNCDDSLWNPRY